jgi:hypothetical protein
MFDFVSSDRSHAVAASDITSLPNLVIENGLILDKDEQVQRGSYHAEADSDSDNGD